MKSQKKIFWYGTDYKDLDNVHSRENLTNVLRQYFNDPCVELYLYADFD